MVLPACLFNSVATLSAIRIVRLLGGGSRLLALCAGLATAICFQPPFGTVNYEQTAMFFDFLALQAVVEALGASGYRRGLWQLASGFLVALAALSKQNFGFFFIPIVFAVAAAANFQMCAGLAARYCWPGPGWPRLSPSSSVGCGCFRTFPRLSRAF